MLGLECTLNDFEKCNLTQIFSQFLLINYVLFVMFVIKYCHRNRKGKLRERNRQAIDVGFCSICSE